MDIGSAITISSGSGDCKKSATSISDIDVISIKSSDTNVTTYSEDKSLRVPVTWNGGYEKCNIDILDFETPTAAERVNQWIGYDYYDHANHEETQTQTSVIVRKDFIKSPSESTTSMELTSPGIKKIQQPKKYLIDQSQGETLFSPQSDVPISRTPINAFMRNNNMLMTTEPNRSTGPFPNTTQSDVYVVPLSPESQKKELYNYLQLMNPLEKKETLLLQHRRSARVKNLSVMLERRQIEQELKRKSIMKAECDDTKKSKTEKGDFIDLTKSTDTNECVTMRSFKDLHIKINRIQEENTENEHPKIRFPTPPPQVVYQVDFDHAMKAWMKEENSNEGQDAIIVANGDMTVNKKNPEEVKGMKKKTKVSENSKSSANKNSTSNRENEVRATKTIMTRVTKANEKKMQKKNQQLRLLKKRSRLIKKLSELSNDFLNESKLRSGLRRKKTLSRPKKTLPRPLKNKIIEDRSQMGKKDKPIVKSNDVKIVNKTSNEKQQTFVQESLVSVPSKEVSVAVKNNATEISTVAQVIEAENIDLRSLVDDISDIENLSEEHMRCLIESRILRGRLLKNIDPNRAKKINFIIPENSLTYVLQKSTQKSTNISTSTSETSHDEGNSHRTTKTQESSSSVEFLSLKIDYSKTPRNLILKQEPQSEECEKESPNEGSAEKEIQTAEVEPVVNVIEKSVPSSCEDSEESIPQKTEQNLVPVDRQSSPSVLSEISNCNSSVEDILPKTCFAFDDDSSESSDSESDNSDSVTSSKVSTRRTVQEVNIQEIKLEECPVVHITKPPETKSLHKSLTITKKTSNSKLESHNSDCDWDSDTTHSPNSTQIRKPRNRLSHSISISKDDGQIMKAFYVDYNLVICQEFLVSVWTQSALGNILGAHNMWIPKGKIQKLVLNDHSVQKGSAEMVISMENSLAYIELWTKEHKSDIRQGPVADIFATIYFWKKGQQGLDKKVLQLENIKGFGEDVQYVVLESAPKIVVSWHTVADCDKSTFIRSYQLAADYQTVFSVNELEVVKHYVSSLHNIKDCDDVLMGCGENKITLWNIDYGYVIATIEMNDIKSPLATLWVKCDRGFLFTVQQCVDGELRLIAINGMNHSWKKLQSYNPPKGFDSLRLKGVTIENGVLISFYEQGILCWNAQSGEPVIEEIPHETEYLPSGNYVIMNTEGHIVVCHALTHLISSDES